MASYTRRTPEQRLEDVDRKIKEFEERKKKLKAQVAKQERKDRTRRLIETGAIFEKHFETTSVEEAQKLILELKALLVQRDDQA
ncbi:putative flavoprotein YhiN [Paenibacillus polymyxa]